MAIPDDQFLERAREFINLSFDIVGKHTQDGENAVIPVSQMFPHGAQDTLFLVYMKICRSLGYYQRGLPYKVLEELADIVNYAAFSSVLLSEELKDGR